MRERRYRSVRFLAAVLVLHGLLLASGGAALAVPSDTDGTAPATGRVDINVADARGLQKVPGIGEALAKRIVEFREQHGPFERVEDLMKVRGIGEKSLDKMRPYLKVGKSR